MGEQQEQTEQHEAGPEPAVHGEPVDVPENNMVGDVDAQTGDAGQEPENNPDDNDDGQHVVSEAAQKDADLVAKHRQGDKKAFGQLYDRHVNLALHLAGGIVGTANAPDVVQDSFVGAWQKLDKLDQPERFKPWFLRIVRNTALNSIRSAKNRDTAGNQPAEQVLDTMKSSELEVEQHIFDNDTKQIVWEAALMLSAQDREILDMQLRYEMTPGEIGETLGTTRNAANQMVHRAKSRLQDAVVAKLLWNKRAKGCPELTALLTGQNIFDQKVVKTTRNHVKTCAVCDQGSRNDAAKIYAGIGIPVVGILLRQNMAAALEAAGIDMSGSVAAGAGSGATGAVGGASQLGKRLLHGGAGVALCAILIIVALLAGQGVTSDEQVEAPTSSVYNPSTSVTEKTVTTTTEQPTTTTVETTTTEEPTTSVTTTSTTTAPPTTVIHTTTAVPPTSTGGNTGPPVTETTTTTTTTVFVAPKVSLTIVPARKTSPWKLGTSEPVANWNVTGLQPGWTVELYGASENVGVTWPEAASGHQTLCPGIRKGSECTSKTGSYLYHIIVRNGTKAIVGETTATLSVV